MPHQLLTGAGFSRNWGGWLANEAFEYLLGVPEVDEYYCIAEHEAANPWEPLHVEHGFKADESVVTVVNAEAPHSMTENVQTDPIEIMRTFADSMSTYGGNNLYSQGHPALVFGPENAQRLSVSKRIERRE